MFYAAQSNVQVDAEIAEKGGLWLGTGQSIKVLLPLSRQQVAFASITLFTGRDTITACAAATAGQRQNMVQSQSSRGKMSPTIVTETGGKSISPPLRAA